MLCGAYFFPFHYLNLLHAAPVVSIQGYWCYVIFIDECTRFTWFHALKKKSDFFSNSLCFQPLIERQFNKKIKVFQSDGGGEHSYNKFQSYFEKTEILHHILCPKTLEQNGLASL